MARGDYRGCDVCDGKAFYDANLNYEAKTRGAIPFRVAGDPQYTDPALVKKYGATLDYVGDWAVICTDCSPRFRTLIEPIGQDGEAEFLSWFAEPAASGALPEGATTVNAAGTSLQGAAGCAKPSAVNPAREDQRPDEQGQVS